MSQGSNKTDGSYSVYHPNTRDNCVLNKAHKWQVFTWESSEGSGEISLQFHPPQNIESWFWGAPIVIKRRSSLSSASWTTQQWLEPAARHTGVMSPLQRWCPTRVPAPSRWWRWWWWWWWQWFYDFEGQFRCWWIKSLSRTITAKFASNGIIIGNIKKQQVIFCSALIGQKMVVQPTHCKFSLIEATP